MLRWTGKVDFCLHLNTGNSNGDLIIVRVDEREMVPAVSINDAAGAALLQTIPKKKQMQEISNSISVPNIDGAHSLLFCQPNGSQNWR